MLAARSQSGIGSGRSPTQTCDVYAPLSLASRFPRFLILVAKRVPNIGDVRVQMPRAGSRAVLKIAPGSVREVIFRLGCYFGLSPNAAPNTFRR